MTGLVPRKPPITSAYRLLLKQTIALRGTVCEFCAQHAAPIAGAGKLRERHCCAHGVPCERGKSEGHTGRWRGNGTHAIWPTCPQCLKAYKEKK